MPEGQGRNSITSTIHRLSVTLAKLELHLSGDGCEHGQISAGQSEEPGGRIKGTRADVKQQQQQQETKNKHQHIETRKR